MGVTPANHKDNFIKLWRKLSVYCTTLKHISKNILKSNSYTVTELKGFCFKVSLKLVSLIFVLIYCSPLYIYIR